MQGCKFSGNCEVIKYHNFSLINYHKLSLLSLAAFEGAYLNHQHIAHRATSLRLSSTTYCRKDFKSQSGLRSDALPFSPFEKKYPKPIPFLVRRCQDSGGAAFCSVPLVGGVSADGRRGGGVRNSLQ